MLCIDIFGNQFVGQLDVRGHIVFGVVGRGAPREGTRNVPIPCVSLYVVCEALLFVELLPTSETLKVFVVPTALCLTVLPPSHALESFAAE